MIFPPFVAFKASVNGDDVFMTCIPEGKDLESCLEFNPKAEVPSLIARFVVERAKDANGDLVHLRSCYKNKYICWNATGFITASASKPNEDQRDRGCTLFRVKDLGYHVVTFSHVYSGSELAISVEYKSTRLATLGDYAVGFKVVGFGELIRLPERVIFKGDNAKYLRSRHKQDNVIVRPGRFGAVMVFKNEYNDFESEGRSDRSAHYEISHYNGFIRIKSVKYGQFLCRTSYKHHIDWIFGDSNDTTINNRDTLFKVIKLGKNVIALRNMGNDKVCCRKFDNALVACEDYVVTEARLIVEEPVDVRYLYAEYRLGDARISSKKLFDYYDTLTSVNRSYKDNIKSEDSASYEKTTNTFWHTTTTLTNTASAKVNIKLPVLKSLGELHVSSESVQVQHLEEGSSSKKAGTFTYKIVVPPRHEGKIKRYVNQVTYEIPYSYIRTDVYTTGEEAHITDKDGVCQGEEHFSAHYENEITPLD